MPNYFTIIASVAGQHFRGELRVTGTAWHREPWRRDTAMFISSSPHWFILILDLICWKQILTNCYRRDNNMMTASSIVINVPRHGINHVVASGNRKKIETKSELRVRTFRVLFPVSRGLCYLKAVYAKRNKVWVCWAPDPDSAANSDKCLATLPRVC